MTLPRPLATALLALALPLHALAAGFDCAKASAPIEQALCGDAELSLADFVLTERYRHLAAHCSAETAQAQRQWLAQTRAAFTPGPAGLDDLRHRYQQRNDQLLRELDACSLKTPIRPLRISTVGGVDSFKLPWVEAPSPEVARRINDVVFARFADLPAAPATLRDAAAALAPRDGEQRGIREVEFTVRRNDGRLLVLEFSAEGCGSYCENFTEQMSFDARNGKALENEALFTEAGLKAMTQHFNATRAARGRALIAHAIRERSAEADALDLYRYCIKGWTGRFSSMPVPELGASGWQLRGGHCSSHASRPWDLLDNLDVPLPRALLQAHLNAYGRSLLLAEGDVRDPAPPAMACRRTTPLPAPPTAPIRSFAVGVQHQLVLLADGQLLAWGANNDGQLGRGEERNDFVPQQAIAVPGQFAQVAAGHGWSAAIDTEGRLWTWGSNYMASLGDGSTTPRSRPVQIGNGYVQLRAEERWGLALHRDGSLWTWGGRTASRDPANGHETYVTRPWKLGDGFAQIELGPRGELQALTRDGEIWTWRGSHPMPGPADTPRRLGTGFTRLAGHQMQAAYKPDGSLWAWGQTLAAMLDTRGENERPPQSVGTGFAQAVYADHGVVAALKDDGSLWLTHRRGSVRQLEQVGCGYQRVALVGTTWERRSNDFRVVALRDDSRLVAWPVKGAPGEPTPAAPWDLGPGWQQLEMADGQWGNRGPDLLLADREGRLWQRRPLADNDRPTAKDWLQRVDTGAR
ncbi:MAG: hypothetical protein EKK53_00160 [Burkholderiales bacterium]|nr:MAG: hypothetical protein EKK53_00160 [Burkholderiales bacterium]